MSERIEVVKSANGVNLVRIQTPGGELFVHPAELRPLPPAEFRELVSKSAPTVEQIRQAAQRKQAELYEPFEYDAELNDPDPYASEREQFEQGSREMFGGQETTEPKEPHPRGRNVLSTIFENTQTTFAVELD